MKKLLALILFLSIINPASAGSDPFLGEIMLFAGNFCPRGYSEAAGQTLAISQNTALFSLYGTTYGGDGRTTFNLPNLRGRVPIHNGTGPGLSPRQLGTTGGAETVILTQATIPNHSHSYLLMTNGKPLSDISNGNILAEDAFIYRSTFTNGNALNSGTISSFGSGQAHNNMSPYATIRYCVVVSGQFPSQS